MPHAHVDMTCVWGHTFHQRAADPHRMLTSRSSRALSSLCWSAMRRAVSRSAAAMWLLNSSHAPLHSSRGKALLHVCVCGGGCWWWWWWGGYHIYMCEDTILHILMYMYTSKRARFRILVSLLVATHTS